MSALTIESSEFGIFLTLRTKKWLIYLSLSGTGNKVHLRKN